MPCQCGTTANVATDADTIVDSGCGCATESTSTCGCGSGAPIPSDRENSLERVVMELDKRVRKLETSH